MAELAIAISKLKKRTGVTIIFALTIFLICAIMSMVIVNAALNNVQRLGRQKDEQQALLAISSAASYVKTLFDGITYYADEVAVPGTDADGNPTTENRHFIYGSSGMSGLTDFQNGFENLVTDNLVETDGAKWINESFSGTAENAITWQIGADGGVVGDSLNVNLNIGLDKDYNIIVTVAKQETVPQEDGTTAVQDGDYSMAFFFYAEVDDEEKTIQWNYASLDR